jgi:uncharacterized membrane protein
MMKICEQTFSETGKRIASIDTIRGLAILMMVFSHALNWFFTGSSHEIITFFHLNAVGDMATPFFYTISGLSLFFSVSSLSKSEPQQYKLFNFYLRRFIQLYLVGVILTKTFGVLQAQAIALLTVAAVFLLTGTYFSSRIGVGAVFFSGLLFFLLHFMIVSWMPPDHFLADYFLGKFPVLAILGMNAAGFYLGYSLQTRGLGPSFAVWGTALTAVSLLLHGNLQAIERIDMSISFILFGIGIVMVMIYVLNLPPVQKNRLLLPIIQVGKDALFLFVAHYLLFFVPLYLFGLINSFNETTAVLLSGLITLAMVKISYWHQKNSYKFSVYGIMEFIFTVAANSFSLLLRPGIETFYASTMQYLTAFNPNSQIHFRLNLPGYDFGEQSRN